mmetsp:Transcript_42954/g.98637  ORF Transcript_42954/g.98637 Transcript_42954/m.98637 type:complete len:201 (+) Transcript_42954:1004-1606(+)
MQPSLPQRLLHSGPRILNVRNDSWRQGLGHLFKEFYKKWPAQQLPASRKRLWSALLHDQTTGLQHHPLELRLQPKLHVWTLQVLQVGFLHHWSWNSYHLSKWEQLPKLLPALIGLLALRADTALRSEDVLFEVGVEILSTSDVMVPITHHPSQGRTAIFSPIVKALILKRLHDFVRQNSRRLQQVFVAPVWHTLRVVDKC